MAERFMPQRVATAFSRLRLTPSRIWWRQDSFAMGLAALVEERTRNRDYEDKPPAYLASIMHVAEPYVIGFVNGWCGDWAEAWYMRGDPPAVISGPTLLTPAKWELRVIGGWDGAKAAEFMDIPTQQQEYQGWWENIQISRPKPSGSTSSRETSGFGTVATRPTTALKSTPRTSPKTAGASSPLFG